MASCWRRSDICALLCTPRIGSTSSGSIEDREGADVRGHGRQAEQDARGGQLEAHVLAEDPQDRDAGVQGDHGGDQAVVDAEVDGAGEQRSRDVARRGTGVFRLKRSCPVARQKATRVADSVSRYCPMLNSSTRRGMPLIRSLSATAMACTRRARLSGPIEHQRGREGRRHGDLVGGVVTARHRDGPQLADEEHQRQQVALRADAGPVGIGTCNSTSR